MVYLDTSVVVAYYVPEPLSARVQDIYAAAILPSISAAPDALHLAVAAAEGLPLVTADQQLARNAVELGVAVELVAPA